MKGADIPRTHQENNPSTQLRLFWEAFCSCENPFSCTVLASALALCGGARRFQDLLAFKKVLFTYPGSVLRLQGQ